MAPRFKTIIKTMSLFSELHVSCLSDFCFGVVLKQTENVFSPSGDTVTLDCTHAQSDHYYMYWYRLSSDRKMELVAYSVGKNTSDTEKTFDKSKFIMLRPEVLKAYLKIHRVEQMDSAVFYCASSRAQ